MRTTRHPLAAHLDTIQEALASGLSLEIASAHGDMRRFIAGQITREINPKGNIRTTHLTDDAHVYVYMTPAGIRILSAQATDRLARRDSILADQRARIAEALGRES